VEPAAQAGLRHGLGVLHYWWKVKLDTTNPMYYALIVGVLLAARVWHQARKAVRAVAVLARAPSGSGKTRLTHDLPPGDARALREALFLDTLDQARAAAAPVTVFFTPGSARDELLALVGHDVHLAPQADGDIGQRMAAAFTHLFGEGARHVALIGSDLPSLPASRLADVFTALEQRDDVVLGPAEDGGYYLVALSRSRPSLFTGVAWGTRDVLRQTIDVAGWSSPVARWAHNPKVGGSNPPPATTLSAREGRLFLATFSLLGGSQHRGQIPSQLDPQLAVPRGQDNRINEPTEALRGLQAGVLALERCGQFLDLRPVEVGHARVQERRRLVGGVELRLSASFRSCSPPSRP
jgi:uncharacterized protein